MNIAITGHRGLIGSFLKRRLESEGHKIVLEVDLRDDKNIRDLKDLKIDSNVDIMIHMAAHCKINKSISNPPKTFDNDVEGTFSVFEFCRKNNIPKVVYFSSSRILNKERNPYTAAKIYGEELCKGYKDAYGIDYIIIRPSTVYAPFWDETRRLIHIFITNALENKDLEIYGNPKIKTLDFTYISDFIDGVMLAINSDKWNVDYNISGGEEFNIYELAKSIVGKTNSSSKIIVKNAETAQPQEVSLDISKIKKLGFSPKIFLNDGVDKCIEFYRDYLGDNKKLFG